MGDAWQPLDRFLPLPAVAAMVGLGRSAIYDRMAAGAFPASRNLGGNCARWLESEVVAWMRSRPTYTPRKVAQPQEATDA